jgi:hypothetical protein
VSSGRGRRWSGFIGFGPTRSTCSTSRLGSPLWGSRGPSVSGAAASTLLAPYLSDVTVVELYVDRSLLIARDRLASVLGGRVVEKGHRIEVRELPTSMSARGPKIESVQVALPARVYADLMASGGRAAEAANHLREVRGVGPGASSPGTRPCGARARGIGRGVRRDTRFVLLGGLVPDLLCSGAAHRHVGTTDVDVQVDLEIQRGSVNAARLEAALREAPFIPDGQVVWRWRDQVAPAMIVKVEFLADLDDVPNQMTISFDECEYFGALNLRGTGFASQDWEVRTVYGRPRSRRQEHRSSCRNVAGVPPRQGSRCAGPWFGEGLVRRRVCPTSQR